MKIKMTQQFNANDLDLSLSPKQLKPLFMIQSHRHAWAIAFNWIIMAISIAVGIYFFHPLLYFLVVLIIGARMHALGILMHDAVHYRFLKNRKWNDLLTDLFCAYPIFTTLDGYRQNHLKHHQHLNTDHDPDWIAKIGKKEFECPKTKLEFITTLLSYLILYQGIRDAIWFLKRFRTPEGNSKKAPKKKNYNRLIFYVLLFTILTIVGGWKWFLLFWFIPYLSAFFMFQYIRSIAEHFGDLSYDHLLTSTRTVKPNWLESFFIAPHQVGYHLEHHLYPGVPFYNLPKLHNLLMEDDSYSGKAHLTQGYMQGLFNELGG